MADLTRFHVTVEMALSDGVKVEEVIATSWELHHCGALVFYNDGKVAVAYAPGRWITYTESEE